MEGGQNLSSTTTTVSNPVATTTTTTITTPPSSSGSQCNCGEAQRKTRIVGGIDTEENEYPWKVRILNIVKHCLHVWLQLMTRSGLFTLGRRCHGVVERSYPSSTYWQQRIAREVTFRQQSRFLLENMTHPMQSPTEELLPSSPSTPTTTTQLLTWMCPSSPWPTPSTSPPPWPPSVCLHRPSLCTSTRRLQWLAGAIPRLKGHHPQYYKKLMLLPCLMHNAKILMAAKFKSMYTIYLLAYIQYHITNKTNHCYCILCW